MKKMRESGAAVPGLESSVPVWARELWEALPEEGEIDVVVPGKPAVRYLVLSRCRIERDAEEAVERQERRRRRSRALFARKRSALARAAGGVSLSFLLLLVSLGYVWGDRGRVEQVLAMEQERRLEGEVAFDAYLSSTRHLLARYGASIRSDLAALDIDPDPFLSAPPRFGGLGGELGYPGDVAFLRERLGRELEELLLDNLDLIQFVGELPSVLPVERARVSSEFGLRRHPFTRRLQHHAGVDLVSTGDPTVRASHSGEVTFAGRNGGYGLTIEITSGYRIVTRYAHLREFSVRVGDSVAAGKPIGIVGSTGMSTGPHLHFEVLVDGVALNPLLTLRIAQNALEESSLRRPVRTGTLSGDAAAP